MRWSRLKGVSPETYEMRGLRIRKQPNGKFLLWQAQGALLEVGTKVRDKTFDKLADAKKWGKTILELG